LGQRRTKTKATANLNPANVVLIVL